MAREQNVSAFIVLYDTTLEEICRIQPTSIAQLRGITGIGERKAEKYGEQILEALKEAEAGVHFKNFCTQAGICDATFYHWRMVNRGVAVNEARPLHPLEEANRRLCS